MSDLSSGLRRRGSLSGPDAFRSRLRKAASRVLAAEISDPLELAIVENLVNGPQSTAELVEEIYGSKRDHAGYMTNYSRTRRALDRLSSRGMVSRGLFGTVKKCRLTEYGFEKLVKLVSGVEPPRILPRNDRIVHIVTLALAGVLVLSVSGRVLLSDLSLVLLNSAFFFMLGLSMCRIIRGLRMVL